MTVTDVNTSMGFAHFIAQSDFVLGGECLGGSDLIIFPWFITLFNYVCHDG